MRLHKYIFACLGAFGKVKIGTYTYDENGERMLRDVAVKQIKGNPDKHEKKRIINEVLTVYQCSHPSIPRCLGHSYNNDKLHIVSAFMDGGNLYEFLRSAKVGF